MDISSMIQKLRTHPEFHKAGMIASHLGVVRGTSRDGREVREIEVSYDHDALGHIIRDVKALDGIVDVLVETSQGRLKIGDEVMAVAIAGDIREHVFAALIEAVNRIKSEASRKKEIFK